MMVENMLTPCASHESCHSCASGSKLDGEQFNAVRLKNQPFTNSDGLLGILGTLILQHVPQRQLVLHRIGRGPTEDAEAKELKNDQACPDISTRIVEEDPTL
mmetsp:Transcript_1078/g.1310  ORF Transcript_1078/g.1310 Transcript_1078/m.1310 type:complete len:102 (-) Transcript_1078:115-420(-)